MHIEHKRWFRKYFSRCDFKQKNMLDGFMPVAGTNLIWHFCDMARFWGVAPEKLWAMIRK